MLKFTKFYFLIAGWLLTTTSLSLAQEFPQELVNTIATESCDCIKSKAQGLDSDAATEAMQGCIQDAVMNHVSELMEYGLTDPDKAQELGIEVANVMLKNCPAMTKMMQGGGNARTSVKTQTSISQATLTEGKVKKIEKGPLTFVLVESEGKTERYLWFNDFEGSSQLMKMGNQAVGKKVKIGWQIRRYYDAQTNAYVSNREIKSFTLLDN